MLNNSTADTACTVDLSRYNLIRAVLINVIESDEDTSIENTENANVAIYSVGGMLYVDGLSADYQVFDVNGRLVYTGHDAQLSLPRGVYMVAVGGEVQKVIL